MHFLRQKSQSGSLKQLKSAKLLCTCDKRWPEHIKMQALVHIKVVTKIQSELKKLSLSH